MNSTASANKNLVSPIQTNQNLVPKRSAPLTNQNVVSQGVANHQTAKPANQSSVSNQAANQNSVSNQAANQNSVSNQAANQNTSQLTNQQQLLSRFPNPYAQPQQQVMPQAYIVILGSSEWNAGISVLGSTKENKVENDDF